MIPRIDHYAFGVVGRDDIIESVVYVESGVKRLVPHLHEGDELRIQRCGKSYGQMELTVLENKHDHLIVTDGQKEFILWGNYHGPTEAHAWLRRDGESEGMLSSLTVLSLDS